MSLAGKVERLLTKENPPPLEGLFLLPLTFIAVLFSFLSRLRRSLYRRGIIPSTAPSIKTICIGNITLGGTGKTPIVESLCRLLADIGLHPAILTRGYGGSLEGQVAVVSDGEDILLTPKEAGDEPVLLAKSLGDLKVPVVMAAKRSEGAALIAEKFSSEVIVMDDGFQHLPMGRDLDIVVVDAKNPFGNGYTLPRGILREPPTALSDADIVLLTRTNEVKEEKILTLTEKIKGYSGGKPLFVAAHTPIALKDTVSGKIKPLTWLKKKKIVAFAGIGKPKSFFDDLEKSGAELVTGGAPLDDHHDYKEADIAELVELAKATGAKALVTTGKDLVKLEGYLPLALPLYVVTLGVEFTDGGEEFIREKLKELFNL